MVMMARDVGKENNPVGVVPAFESLIKTAIDRDGVYPTPCLYEDKNGTHNICALDLPPHLCMQYFMQQIVAKTATEIIIGLDRFVKPGQSAEFKDILTICYWKDGLSLNKRGCYKTGIINYQHEPRIVRPIEWKNEFWTPILERELDKMLDKTLVK